MTFRRYRLLILAFCMPSLASCKFNSGSKASDSGQEEIVEVAVVNEIHPFVNAFFESLQSQKRLHKHPFEEVSKILGAKLSNEVRFVRSEPGGTVDPYGGDTSKYSVDIYRGIEFGERVFIFKEDNGNGVAEKYWLPMDYVPSTVLAEKSLEERVRYYMDTKYYEPDRIKRLTSSINTAEFIFRFIPMYGGAEQMFVSGQSTWDRFMGAVQIAGDAATLGLGSKIRIVKQGSASIVATAASVRISKAVYDTANGEATYATGVDAFLATIEASLATVTLVKLRVSAMGGFVNNLDEAKVLSRELGRNPDDILKNGLTTDEMSRFLKLNKNLDHLEDAARPWLRSLTSCMQGAAGGFAFASVSLKEPTTVAGESCEILAQYSENLSKYGFEYGWIAKKQLDDLSALTGVAERKKFLAALKKGMAEGRAGATGIVKLDPNRPHKNLRPGYTHELKIAKSAARILGKIEEVAVQNRTRRVIVFDDFIPEGLH